MKTFISDSSGAVTVDWVVLTAALVGLGLAVMSVVSSGIEDVSTDTKNALTSQVIQTSFTPSNEDIVANYTHRGCPEGTDAALEFAAAHFALGDPDDNSYDYEAGDEEGILTQLRERDPASLQTSLNAWRNDYENRPDVFTLAHSNDVEYALVECVAAEKGLS